MIKKPLDWGFFLVNNYQESLALNPILIYNCNSFVNICNKFANCGK